MKRLLPFLLALFMLLSCLAACKDKPSPDEETTDTDATDIPTSEQVLDLVKDGASDYVIVRPADISADDPAFVAAVLLRDAIERMTGVALQIVTDDETDYTVADKEIVIGNARGAAYADNTVYASESKLYIGGEAQLLSDMIAAFISAAFNCNINSGELPALTTL
ncbi:MAG: hypothetical protein J6Q16_03510, partial [Clostridia bacterium]|nr:hypothetical protein [Clostridia bacterium]